MILWLLRHGIAVDRADPACPADADRPLTAKGRRRTYAAAGGLAALDVAPELILSSPYQRAMETAEIAEEVLLSGAAGSRGVEVTDALLPSAEPAELFATLPSLGVQSVLCCGHSPNLERVVSEAIGARFGSLFLKKCGCACLQFGFGLEDHAELLWLQPAGALRMLDLTAKRS